MAKTGTELANQMVQEKPRRTLRDIDDFQSYMFPDVSSQEFVEGLKTGKTYYPSKADTAARENLNMAVMSELGLSPRAYNKILQQYNRVRKPNENDPYGAGEYSEDFINKWDEWDKAGRPKTNNGDWSQDFSSNYGPDGYLRWYRPQEQWGKSMNVHVQDEWKNKYDPDGDIHEGFNPYKAGYSMARESWDNFFKKYGNSIVNPNYKDVLDWLDKNKEYF